MDYQMVDQILDDFQKDFKEIKVKDDLANASIERWRWDLPQIRLVWKQQDVMWRNINILLDTLQSEGDRLIGRIEVNAWLDVQKDNRWIRRWQHQLIREGPINHQLVWESYEIVVRWNPSELPYEEPLSEAASMLLDQQRG
jgi:hypothetical protein